MNPPYGRGIGAWATKAADEFESGRVSALVALVPARVDTSWWARLVSTATLVCFIRGRLHFSGHPDAAPFPSALVYMGSTPETFQRAVAGLGLVYQRSLA